MTTVDKTSHRMTGFDIRAEGYGMFLLGFTLSQSFTFRRRQFSQVRLLLNRFRGGEDGPPLDSPSLLASISKMRSAEAINVSGYAVGSGAR